MKHYTLDNKKIQEKAKADIRFGLDKLDKSAKCDICGESVKDCGELINCCGKLVCADCRHDEYSYCNKDKLYYPHDEVFTCNHDDLTYHINHKTYADDGKEVMDDNIDAYEDMVKDDYDPMAEHLMNR